MKGGGAKYNINTKKWQADTSMNSIDIELYNKVLDYNEYEARFYNMLGIRCPDDKVEGGLNYCTGMHNWLARPNKNNNLLDDNGDKTTLSQVIKKFLDKTPDKQGDLLDIIVETIRLRTEVSEYWKTKRNTYNHRSRQYLNITRSLITHGNWIEALDKVYKIIEGYAPIDNQFNREQYLRYRTMSEQPVMDVSQLPLYENEYENTEEDGELIAALNSLVLDEDEEEDKWLDDINTKLYNLGIGGINEEGYYNMMMNNDD
jgi:hypothetical protein